MNRTSLHAIELARANGIVMHHHPPIHVTSSARLKPLDKTVFGPLKSSYNRSMDGRIRSNPRKTVTIYEIPSHIKEAQLSAMTTRNILSGFQNTGIFPFNRYIYTDADFAPATLKHRDIPNGVARIFVWGGHPADVTRLIFRDLQRPTRFGGGG